MISAAVNEAELFVWVMLAIEITVAGRLVALDRMGQQGRRRTRHRPLTHP
jgi:hypothetical protein